MGALQRQTSVERRVPPGQNSQAQTEGWFMNFPTSPTPPPPSPYSTMPLPAFEPVDPGLSEPQRLVNVFIAPTKTFTDLKRNPSWWVPWLVSGIFLLMFGAVAGQKVDFDRFMQREIDKSPAAQKRMEQLPPEQRDKMLHIQGLFAR